MWQSSIGDTTRQSYSSSLFCFVLLVKSSRLNREIETTWKHLQAIDGLICIAKSRWNRTKIAFQFGKIFSKYFPLRFRSESFFVCLFVGCRLKSSIESHPSKAFVSVFQSHAWFRVLHLYIMLHSLMVRLISAPCIEIYFFNALRDNSIYPFFNTLSRTDESHKVRRFNL